MSSCGEEWRAVLGVYEVSSLGRFRRGSHIKNQRATPIGVRYVSVYVHGKKRTVAVHRLVAAAFLGECPQGLEVNHKDGNRGHNEAGNLEYVTHSENMLHAYRTGLLRVSPTRRNHVRLTEVDVRAIRAAFAAGVPCRSIMQEFEISKGYAYDLKRGRYWPEVRVEQIET